MKSALSSRPSSLSSSNASLLFSTIRPITQATDIDIDLTVSSLKILMKSKWTKIRTLRAESRMRVLMTRKSSTRVILALEITTMLSSRATRMKRMTLFHVNSPTSRNQRLKSQLDASLSRKRPRHPMLHGSISKQLHSKRTKMISTSISIRTLSSACPPTITSKIRTSNLMSSCPRTLWVARPAPPKNAPGSKRRPRVSQLLCWLSKRHYRRQRSRLLHHRSTRILSSPVNSLHLCKLSASLCLLRSHNCLPKSNQWSASFPRVQFPLCLFYPAHTHISLHCRGNHF